MRELIGRAGDSTGAAALFAGRIFAPDDLDASFFEEGDQLCFLHRFVRVVDVEGSADFVSATHGIEGKDVANLGVEFGGGLNVAGSAVEHSGILVRKGRAHNRLVGWFLEAGRAGIFLMFGDGETGS